MHKKTEELIGRLIEAKTEKISITLSYKEIGLLLNKLMRDGKISAFGLDTRHYKKGEKNEKV